MVTAKKAKEGTKAGVKRWKSDSADGKLLCKLLKNKTVSPGVTPAALKENYPQFSVYKEKAFAAALRRLKNKYSTDCRAASGEIVVSYLLCHCLQFYESSSLV